MQASNQSRSSWERAEASTIPSKGHPALSQRPFRCPSLEYAARRWPRMGLVSPSSCTIFPSRLSSPILLLSSFVSLSSFPFSLCARVHAYEPHVPEHKCGGQRTLSCVCPHLLPCLRHGLGHGCILQASLPHQLSGFSCLLPFCCRRARTTDAHCHTWLYLRSEPLILILVWRPHLIYPALLIYGKNLYKRPLYIVCRDIKDQARGTRMRAVFLLFFLSVFFSVCLKQAPEAQAGFELGILLSMPPQG